MEIVWKEVKEWVRLENGNLIQVVRQFNRAGEQVDWKVIAFHKRGAALKEAACEF